MKGSMLDDSILFGANNTVDHVTEVLTVLGRRVVHGIRPITMFAVLTTFFGEVRWIAATFILAWSFAPSEGERGAGALCREGVVLYDNLEERL